jgi:hypothetical protein
MKLVNPVFIEYETIDGRRTGVDPSGSIALGSRRRETPPRSCANDVPGLPGVTRCCWGSELLNRSEANRVSEIRETGGTKTIGHARGAESADLEG